MAFTNGDDINILQASDTSIVGAGQGDDIYIISALTMTAGQEITLTDSFGTNTLQLIDGLTIASSKVASNALQLTLSNGAVVNINDADSFTFNIAGNVIMGEAGVDKNFSTFVSQNLDTSVPTDDSINSGGQITIAQETPVELTTTSADIGTLESAATLDASGGGFIFTDDASVLNRVEISNFTSDDVIQISNASEGDYSFEHDGSDMNIIYNNLDDSVVNHITLTGVVDPSDILLSEADFEASIGFDAVTYA